MRVLLVAFVAVLMLSPIGFSQILDDSGDIINLNVSSKKLAAPGGARAPGDILNTIIGPYSGPNGFGHDGVNLLVIYYPSSEITVVDETTGAQVGTIPLDGTYDFGLAYDSKRKVYVTVNPSSDDVKIYDGVSSSPINSWPAPGSGPVGAAYDSNRDVYWICDWSSNDVASVDPTTGATITVYSTAGFPCTRNIGVGYDAVNDELIVGGRDQAEIFVMDAATGALKLKFPAHGSGSAPRGTTVTPRLTIWEGDYLSDTLWELDMGHKLTSLTANVSTISEAKGGVVDFTIDAGVANANRQYLMFANFTGTSPGFSPPPGLVTIPINWDIFTNLTLKLTNTAIFQNFYGNVDVNGQGTAQFNTLGPFTGGAGLTLNFAFGMDLTIWDVASNAVSVDIVP